MRYLETPGTNVQVYIQYARARVRMCVCVCLCRARVLSRPSDESSRALHARWRRTSFSSGSPIADVACRSKKYVEVSLLVGRRLERVRRGIPRNFDRGMRGARMPEKKTRLETRLSLSLFRKMSEIRGARKFEV